MVPNKNTTLLAVPARRDDVGDGSLAVLRVLQNPVGDSRISVESSLAHDPPGLCVPPVTSRTWLFHDGFNKSQLDSNVANKLV